MSLQGVPTTVDFGDGYRVEMRKGSVGIFGDVFHEDERISKTVQRNANRHGYDRVLGEARRSVAKHRGD